jgi:hypothetical protein
MNIEEVEHVSIAYLKQVSNPLVRIHALHAHVVSKSEKEILSLHEFSDFLSNHSEIKVMDPLAMVQDDKTAENLKTAGFTTGLCAILSDRVPIPLDLATAMLEQLESMTTALSNALKEARATGDSPRAHQIYETLERTSKLKAKIVEFTSRN